VSAHWMGTLTRRLMGHPCVVPWEWRGAARHSSHQSARISRRNAAINIENIAGTLLTERVGEAKERHRFSNIRRKDIDPPGRALRYTSSN